MPMHDDQSSVSTAKYMYENAQHNSASRKGNALFQSFSSNQNTVDSSLRERRAHDSASASSVRSSINTSAYTPHTSSRGVSPMGHRLTHVSAPEEEYGVELDREEMRRLAKGDDRIDDDGFTSGTSFRDLDQLSVNSGTGKSPNNSTTRSTMIYPKKSTSMKDRLSSPKCQLALVLFAIALLLATCLVFTFVNMHIKDYEDWIEPNKDAYLNEGMDWAPGPDAPPRFMGADVDSMIEKNIANWALGTLRVKSETMVDGHGSVSMSPLVLARDVPLFFGTEYTGANVLDMLLGQCLNLIQASKADMEELTGDETDQLSLIWSNGRQYVNVDITTTTGIDRAFSLGLVKSGLADVIYSPLLHDVSSLFSPKNQARLFVMMRHPVEAQFARLRHLKVTSSTEMPERYDELTKMSYQEFADSEFVDDDWMTRALVNKIYGETLTPQDMETAKEILRRKAIVGLYDEPLLSFKKFARYFDWDHVRMGGYFTADTEKCFESLMEVAKSKDEVLGDVNLNEEDAKEGSDAWKTIMDRNKYDYELYMYGKNLYKYQIGLS